MLIPTYRFFVVPVAAACVLLALAATQKGPSQAGQAVAIAKPAQQTQACHVSANGPNKVCAIPAG